MRRSTALIAVALWSSTLLSVEAQETTTSLDERVALKKIAQYWEENDLPRVKSTIVNFVENYPQSTYGDQLCALLGDLYFAEKNYERASLSYAKIRGGDFGRKVAFHQLHSLYELKRFEEFVPLAPSFLKDPLSNQKEIETISFELAEACRSLGQQTTGETQRKWFQEALTHYERLLRTSFESLALPHLTHLYVSVSDYPKAAQTYLRRAQFEEGNKEELLFHAATYQIYYDKKSALDTFDRIFTLKGPLAEKAAYNMLVLLFQMGRYADVVTTSIYVGNTLPKDKMGLIHYYTGKSLFYQKDFDAAAEMLEEALVQKGNEELKENIILTLISCAKESNDLSLCDRMIKELHNRNVDEETLTAAFLIHSQLCRNHKEWSIARESIETLLRSYPQHKERETLLYDLALLLMREEKFEESADTFSTFMKEYPSSPHHQDALRNILQLKLNAVMLASTSDKKTAEEQCAKALEALLQEKEALTLEEQKRLRLALARFLFRLDSHERTILTLTEYLRDFPEDPSCKEAYLLLSSCYQGKEDKSYVLYTEKALALDPQLETQSRIHRLLFNSYLKLSEQGAEGEKQEAMAKAADHLFRVTDGSVAQENQRWLAGYYLKQGKDSQKAIVVLERLLKLHGNTLLLAPHVEGETVKLALLYQELGRLTEGISLLEQLHQEQSTHPDLEWKYARMTQFELARFYRIVGKTEKAIDLYQDLISSSSHLSSYFALAAKLELAKLAASQLENSPLPDREEKLLQICDDLKEVAIQRQPYSEPLHMEAALHYAAYKAQLYDRALQPDKKCSLLEQVKQDLLADSEAHWAAFPEKKELVDQYVSYIEIELSHLKGQSEQKTKEQLHELLPHVYNETLKERVVKKLEELDHHL